MLLKAYLKRHYNKQYYLSLPSPPPFHDPFNVWFINTLIRIYWYIYPTVKSLLLANMNLIWFNLPIIAPNIPVTFGYFIRDWNISHSDWREEKILALQSHHSPPPTLCWASCYRTSDTPVLSDWDWQAVSVVITNTLRHISMTCS